MSIFKRKVKEVEEKDSPKSEESEKNQNSFMNSLREKKKIKDRKRKK